MKIYQIIILLISIVYIYSGSCVKENPSKKSECHDLYTEEQKKTGSCCYLKAKADGETVTVCMPLTNEQKNNIKDYIKDLEKGGGDVKSLDCKASYLSIGLFSLILILF